MSAATAPINQVPGIPGIIQALQARPGQTPRDLAAVTGYSERHILRILPSLPGITSCKEGRRVLYSLAAEVQSPDQESTPPQSITGDTERDKKGTPKTRKKGLSLSAVCVEVLQAEPDRSFVIQDLVDQTGGSYGTVKRTLLRLSKTGKGAGPVRRIPPGIYQYAPEKEHENLQALVRAGPIKFENLTFVPCRTQGGAASLSRTSPEPQKGTPPDTPQPTPRAGFPWVLPTGQTVSWGRYDNGMEIIRISTNGSPPFGADGILGQIYHLKREGFDPYTWNCVSMEVNVDSRKLRLDASYSIQLVEGVVLKCYQHGYNARVELADHRARPAREVLELFHAVTGRLDGTEALGKVAALEKKVGHLEKTARLALSVARNARDGQPTRPGSSRKPAKKDPLPGFRTGADIHKERVAAGAGKRGKNR